MKCKPGKSSKKNPSERFFKCTALIFLLFFFAGRPWAAGIEEGRIWAGLKLFPSFMAADMDIVHKKNPDGNLLILLVYADQKTKVLEMARYLEKVEKIRGVPLRTELTDDTSLEKYADQQLAGIFLTQKIDTGFHSIIKYARDHHVFVFSPFEEDVENGATGGMLIRERVYPYLNREALDSGGIRIKTFFLRISKFYEGP